MCQTRKPVDQFHKDKRRRDGLASNCKTCRNRGHDAGDPWVDAVLASSSKDLPLFLTAEAAPVIRQWAKEVGLNLIEHRRRGAKTYPYTCRRGHLVRSPEDEFRFETAKRKYCYCAECKREDNRKNQAKQRAKRRLAKELAATNSGGVPL